MMFVCSVMFNGMLTADGFEDMPLKSAHLGSYTFTEENITLCEALRPAALHLDRMRRSARLWR